MVAGSREGMNRTLARFTGEGLVENDGGRLVVVRADELERRAEPWRRGR